MMNAASALIGHGFRPGGRMAREIIAPRGGR
jgi:hypothetical protein